MLNTTELTQGEALPPTEYHPEDCVAVIHHGVNGSSSPLEAVPLSWGLLVNIDDLALREVPGPHYYETVPLRRAIRRASLIVLHLWSHPDPAGVARAQGTRSERALAAFDAWQTLRRGKSILFIQTYWTWLAPWEARIQDEALPGTTVEVLDAGGRRSLQFRARGQRKRLRART